MHAAPKPARRPAPKPARHPAPKPARQPHLVAIGEVMLELSAPAPMTELPTLVPCAAGDTFNVTAVAAALGTCAGYLGFVGDDLVGDAVLASAARTGVDISCIGRRPGPTGLYLVSTDASGERAFTYFRAGSVAGLLDRSVVDHPYVRGARAIHSSGITAALSDSARDAVLAAFVTARERGAFTSFDVNHRSALMPRDAAAACVAAIAPHCSLVVTSLQDARELACADCVAGALSWLLDLGAEAVLVSEGAAGATLGIADGTLAVAPPGVGVVDTTGAGDALTGAFLHATLAGAPALQALRLGCATAAVAVGGRGALGAVATAAEAERLATSVRLR